MADQFDQASEIEALTLHQHLQNQQAKAAKQPTIASKGVCLYCGEPLSDGKRWCDALCRDEWQRENPDL